MKQVIKGVNVKEGDTLTINGLMVNDRGKFTHCPGDKVTVSKVIMEKEEVAGVNLNNHTGFWYLTAFEETSHRTPPIKLSHHQIIKLKRYVRHSSSN
jgi:hypothetical protein